MCIITSTFYNNKYKLGYQISKGVAVILKNISIKITLKVKRHLHFNRFKKNYFKNKRIILLFKV